MTIECLFFLSFARIVPEDWQSLDKELQISRHSTAILQIVRLILDICPFAMIAIFWIVNAEISMQSRIWLKTLILEEYQKLQEQYKMPHKEFQSHQKIACIACISKVWHLPRDQPSHYYRLCKSVKEIPASTWNNWNTYVLSKKILCNCDCNYKIITDLCSATCSKHHLFLSHTQYHAYSIVTLH